MTATSIAWDDLREVSLRDLKPGDRWLNLPAFTVCWVSADGRMRGNSYEQPRGTVWTLQKWDGFTATAVSDTATAVSDTGAVLSQEIPEYAKVNHILPSTAVSA